MKIKNKLLKQIAIGIMSSALVFSAVPQMPVQNNVSAVEAAAKVKLNTKKVYLRVGSSKRLVLKNAKGKITWKSNKKSVATVSKKGLVRAKKKGRAVISAVYNGRKYKCDIVVRNKKGSDSSSTGSGTGNGGGSGSGVVYWTPGGSVYHVSRSCPTLSRSSVVFSGSIASSGKGRACKVCS
ncbi:MAG: Ig-like domain-containing protein [Lachnospiraceae bacterium]|nr:Ig-like domain-containing protein [Lachnospiraceae bacterium]